METNTSLYFAYGSNMDVEQMRRRIPDARVVGRAVLKGWRVAERLYADIEKSRGGRVYGVLYLLSENEMRHLDIFDDGEPLGPLPRPRLRVFHDEGVEEGARRQALSRILQGDVRRRREVLGASLRVREARNCRRRR